MTQKPVKLQIPFQSLVDAIFSLGIEDKQKLLVMLEEEISQGQTNHALPNYPLQNHKNISYNTSKNFLTFEEMISQYPDRWLLIGEPEVDENQNIIRGQVLAYSADEQEIYNALSLFDIKSKAIEYTGSIPEDFAVLMGQYRKFINYPVTGIYYC